jgi:nuclear protein localization family protein 4
VVNTQVAEAHGVQFTLSTDPGGSITVPMEDQSLAQCNVKHGEILFLHAERKLEEPTSAHIKLDAVDLQLEKETGFIKRKRDSQYCQHGPQGMCSHCQPLEPFDAQYAESRGIKHLSFHAYLRKLGVGRKEAVLEEADYHVKRDCNRHAPYPAGICSACQPGAISLNPQTFRLTDHVEFERPALVEGLLAGWRTSGWQCFGWLYGRYERYDEVPLGIKAVVCAIYEPPQDGSVDGFHLLNDPYEENVERAAALVGLQRVGMIYTDLRDDGTGSGKVEYQRTPETFFLSSAECLFIAEQQRIHPNPCRHSKSGHYGSKFVTVVVSGDASNDIGLSAYQVSLTAMAMADADIVSATTDPSLMMVRPSTSTQYVPEVLYKYKGEYGEVQAVAQPTFPVDYLIVSLSHGFPVRSQPLFSSNTFMSPAKPPTLTNLSNYLLPVPANTQALLGLLADLNLFVYLLSLDIFSEAELQLLAKAISDKNDTLTLEAFRASNSWQNLLTMLKSDGRSTTNGSREAPIDLAAEEDQRQCPHCTFINTHRNENCEVCSLPLSF